MEEDYSVLLFTTSSEAQGPGIRLFHSKEENYLWLCITSLLKISKPSFVLKCLRLLKVYFLTHIHS